MVSGSWDVPNHISYYYNVVLVVSQMVAVEIVQGTVSQCLRRLGIIGIDMGRNENSALSPEKEHIEELLSILYLGAEA